MKLLNTWFHKRWTMTSMSWFDKNNVPQKQLPRSSREKLLQIRKTLSEAEVKDFAPKQLTKIIYDIHAIISHWSGRPAIADAFLQTVSVDISFLMIAENRKAQDSCAHELRYDDQIKFGPKSSPEAAQAGLLYLVTSLLAERQKSDPIETLCELIGARWEQEAYLRVTLYQIRDRLLWNDNVSATDTSEDLRAIFKEKITAFERLTWGPK